MKESKLIEMQKRVDGLTNVVKNLIQEIHANITLAQGTLTAFQLHIGEERWDELVKEMKEVEKRQIKETQDKKKEEEKQFETPEDVE